MDVNFEGNDGVRDAGRHGWEKTYLGGGNFWV